ncbi:S1C family serine protease [Kitasatospora aureofaciens]|uniref:S1C family serine protease n=1 Tax=Kitasatospora aureofaciens TaxID=1894 RepID=UPI00380AE194
MSTEREVGPTGSQGEQPSGSREAAGAVAPAPDGHKPTLAFGRIPEPEAAPAAPAAAAPAAAAPAAEPEAALADGGHKPTMAFSRVPEPEAAPAVPAPAAPAAPAAEPEAALADGGHKPTMAFTKVPAPEAAPAAPAAETPAAPAVETGYIDAPPPVLPPAPPAPAAPAAPAAAAPVAAPAPGLPAGANPYATPTHGVPAAGAHDPYGAPAAPGAPAAHHPFGAGQPLGGWGAAHDTTAGGPGYPGGPGAPGGPLGYPGAYPGGPGGPGAPRKKRGGLVALIAAVALVAGIAGGAVGVTVSGDKSTTATADDHRSTTIQASNTQKNEPAPGSIASIAQKALPSVVTIKAQGNGESGTGTGFVFDTEGHILTNNHVVAPAVTGSGGKLTVKFADGSSYSASVLGRAEGYDVAVVKLDNPPKGKLAPLTLADSDKVNVGDASIAIGAPYGLESTVTSGIISAKDRPVASGDETGAQASYMNALQTDASINPGNSGGPLLDSSGAVVGINSAIQSNASANGRAGSIGLGFAIPINQAKWVADTLIKTGKPVYAKLDVLRDDNYKGDGAAIQTRDVQGQPAVTPGGAADKAGLKPGDVITKLGGAPIENGPALVSRIWTHKPGETVDVEYVRNGQTMTTKVTLGSREGDTPS